MGYLNMSVKVTPHAFIKIYKTKNQKEKVRLNLNKCTNFNSTFVTD